LCFSNQIKSNQETKF